MEGYLYSSFPNKLLCESKGSKATILHHGNDVDFFLHQSVYLGMRQLLRCNMKTSPSMTRLDTNREGGPRNAATELSFSANTACLANIE